MKENKREDLLRYYEQELDYFRTMGAAFSQKYPKIASRLELSSSQGSDPHVERLIEAFAFLTARIQLNIDSEFPEITYALLDNLYPHFLEPIPSISVAALHFDDNSKLNAGVTLPRDSQFAAQMSEGYTINFRSAFPATLYPFSVTAVEVCEPSLFPDFVASRNAAAVIRVRIESKNVPLEQFNLQSLRFYLGGNKSVAFELYELLQSRLIDIGVSSGDGVVRLGSQSVQEVGFKDEEQLLPSRPTAHPQYRLLQEYFAFPEKFLFIDVVNIDKASVRGNSMELLFAVDTMIQEHRLVVRENFMMNVVPVVNLFPKISEPIYVDHKHIQYRLIPDVRRDMITEVHSIRSVSGSTDERAEHAELRPYFSLHHGSRVAASEKAFWYARRIPTGRKDKPGTEVYLSFVDKDFNPTAATGGTVFSHILCTNRHLAENLPERTILEAPRGIPVSRVTLVHQPTRQIDPPISGSMRWRLISHLSLNYLSLTKSDTALGVLKEMLRLYNVTDMPYIERQIEAVMELHVRNVTRRVGNTMEFGYLHGKEILLTLNEDSFAGASAYMLARVLHEFYTLHSRVNSFTQVAVRGVKQTQIWKRWSPVITL